MLENRKTQAYWESCENPTPVATKILQTCLGGRLQESEELEEEVPQDGPRGFLEKPQVYTRWELTHPKREDGGLEVFGSYVVDGSEISARKAPGMYKKPVNNEINDARGCSDPSLQGGTVLEQLTLHTSVRTKTLEYLKNKLESGEMMTWSDMRKTRLIKLLLLVCLRKTGRAYQLEWGWGWVLGKLWTSLGAKKPGRDVYKRLVHLKHRRVSKESESPLVFRAPPIFKFNVR